MQNTDWSEKLTKKLFWLIASILVMALVFFGQEQFGVQEEMSSQLPIMVSSVRSMPFSAPLVLFGLAVLQGFLPVIPFFLLAGTSGAVYGIWLGMLLIWVGAVLGATLLFLLIRVFAKEYFQLWMEKRAWNLAVSDEKGFLAILLGRLVPVVPSAVVNIAAGVSKVNLVSFGTATALGKLPWTLFYAAMGYNLSKGETWAIYLALMMMVGCVTLGVTRWLKA